MTATVGTRPVTLLPGPVHSIARGLKTRFPLTLLGLGVLVLALVSLRFFGYGSMDLVAFALAVCALAFLGFSLLAVVIGGLLLRRRIAADLPNQSVPDRSEGTGNRTTMEAGYPNETGFSLPAMAWLPLISLSWRVVYPDSVDCRISLSPCGTRWEEEIIPGQRFLSSRLVRLFTVRDVLGLCRFSWRMGHDQPMMALPQAQHLRAMPLLRSLTAEDGFPDPAGSPEGDRMEIRPYAPGDSVRNIMWKAYARSRELNVRLAERSVFNSRRTVAYLLSGPGDEAAAAVARVAIESGALGEDWLFGADGSDEPYNDTPQALAAIARSRPLTAPHPNGLDTFLSRRQVQSSSHCIIFAAAEPGPWMEGLRAAAGQYRGNFTIVLATDGVGDPVPEGWWQRLIYRRSTDGATAWSAGFASRATTGSAAESATATARVTMEELGQLIRDVSRAATSTLVVDRRTGLSFDQKLNKI